MKNDKFLTNAIKYYIILSEKKGDIRLCQKGESLTTS